MSVFDWVLAILTLGVLLVAAGVNGYIAALGLIEWARIKGWIR